MMGDYYEMLVGDLQDQIAELDRENKKMRDYILTETACACRIDGIENLCLKCRIQLQEEVLTTGE